MKKAKHLMTALTSCLAVLALAGCAKNKEEAPTAKPNKTVEKTADIQVNPKAVINNNLHYNNYIKSYMITSHRQLDKTKSTSRFILGNTPMKLKAYSNSDKTPSMYVEEGMIYIKAHNSLGKTVWIKQDNAKRASTIVSANAKSANQYANTFANPVLANMAKAKTTNDGFLVYITDTSANRKQIQDQYSQDKKGLTIKHYKINLRTNKKGKLISFTQTMEYKYKKHDNKQTIIINNPNEYNNLSVPKSVTKHAINSKKINIKQK